MFKHGLVDSVVKLLSESGFRTVDCRGSRSSFDVLAKREDSLILVKTLANVEGLSREGVSELKAVAELLGGVPVVVGEKMKTSDLADDVVYDRYGVCVSNVKTFDSIVNGNAPTVHSKRGNYCVQLNSGMLAAARRDLGLTQEELAHNLGVTKQTVYRYESSGSVSLDVFERLIEVFGRDILAPNFKLDFERGRAETLMESHITSFKRLVKEEFESIGFHTDLTNAPFDMVASQRERVFSVVSNDWRRLEDKINVLEEISDITGGYTVCISERRVKSETSVLSPEDLSKIKSPRELFKLLSDK